MPPEIKSIGSAVPLPDYARPPVIEVVYSVQFKNLAKFRVPFVGALWQFFRTEYPTTEERPPLQPVIENLNLQRADQEHYFDLSSSFPRSFFVSDAGNWVIQIQRDRFCYNWRKVKDEDEYPRYEEVSRRFFQAWATFENFCESEGLAPVEITQLELTYINHVPAGQAWKSLDDIGHVFPDICWRTGERFLPTPESAQWLASYRLPDRKGRLNLALRHAMRQSDKKPVLLCELTARGLPSDHATPMADWFDLAREAIVRGFADLTDERVQYDIWGRKT